MASHDNREEDALLRSIQQNPDNSTPYYVYADYLEDKGDSKQAEYYRNQGRLLDSLHPIQRQELKDARAREARNNAINSLPEGMATEAYALGIDPVELYQQRVEAQIAAEDAIQNAANAAQTLNNTINTGSSADDYVQPLGDDTADIPGWTTHTGGGVTPPPPPPPASNPYAPPSDDPRTAQQWLDSLPKGTKTRIKDWLNSDLGARQEAQFKKVPYGLKELDPVTEQMKDILGQFTSRDKNAGSKDDPVTRSMIDLLRDVQQQTEDEYTQHERRYDTPPKSKREKLKEDKAREAQEREKLEEDREDWRVKADRASETWKDRKGREKEQQAKREAQEKERQERDAKRVEREREEMNRLRWASLENIGDEALNTASEGPISAGGGAASGSNMGAFARRLKNTGGRLYNAIKGRRFGRKQFQNPRHGPGSGASPPGKGGGASRPGVPGGGKPPIPPVGPGGAAAGAAGAGGGAGGGAAVATGAAGAAGAGGAAGAALAAAGPAVAIAALGVAAIEAGKAVYAFARAQEDTVRKLSEFGGQQAVGIALLDANRAFRDFKTAQETGGSSLQLTQSINRFEDKLQPIESALTNIANIMASQLLTDLGEIVQAVTPALKLLEDIAKKLGADVDDAKFETTFDIIDRMEREQAVADVQRWPDGQPGFISSFMGR